MKLEVLWPTGLHILDCWSKQYLNHTADANKVDLVSTALCYQSNPTFKTERRPSQ